MRLTINQKMAGTAVFLLVSTAIVGPILWAKGMSVSEVTLDRLMNVPLTIVAALQQDKFRRLTNRLLDRYRGRRRYQILRPVFGIGELFAVQAALYALLMPFMQFSDLGLMLGLANLLAGSVALWIWQEKYRWILAQREWGRRTLAPRLAWATEALRRLATRRTP